MRVLVIGGTNFIGPPAVRALRQAGHDVTVLHRTDCGDASHVHADRAEARGEFDVAVDMFAMTERDARTFVDLHIAPRLVVISSQDVYRQYGRLVGHEPGDPDPVPLDENAPLREKLYPYREGLPDYDKILVERVVAEVGATVLRLPAVYGPGDHRDRFAEFELPMDEAYANWRWTRAYVENVADAIVLAATHPHAAGRTYNVGEPDAPTQQEWARMVTGREPQTSTESPFPFDFRAHFVTDSGAIRRELGYAERVSREEAIAATNLWRSGTSSSSS